MEFHVDNHMIGKMMLILGLPLDNCALLRKPAMVFSLSDHKSMFCLTFKRRKNTGKTTYQLYLYSSSFIEYIIWAHIFITITYYSTRPLKGLLYCFSFSFHKKSNLIKASGKDRK